MLQFLINGLITGTLYGVVAMCFVLIYKSTRVVNFAQGEFLLIGGWVCLDLVLSRGLGFLPAFAVTLVFMFLFGLAIQRVILRPLIGEPIISVIMVTIGLSTVFYAATNWIFGTDAKSFPSDSFVAGSLVLLGTPEAPDLQVARAYLFSIATSLLIMGGFFWFFNYSRWGLAMRATSFDQQVASSLGISVRQVFALAWGISAVVSAVAGIVTGIVTTVSGGLALTGVKVFPAVILGGLDSIAGALVGGIIIGVLENLAQYVDGSYLAWGNLYTIAPFYVLIVMLMIKPYGLFGTRDIERV